MSFFKKKRTRAPQGVLLRPRRSRVFRRSARENVEGAKAKISPWTIGYAFLWGAFAVAAIFTLFFSPLLRIHRKAVVPMRTVSESAVSAVVEKFLSGKSLGLFPNDTLPAALLRRRMLEQGLLAQFPILRHADVSFLFPETIALSLEERKTTLILCSGGPCFFADEFGFVFDTAPEPFSTGDPDAILTVIDSSAKPVSFRDPIFSEEFFRSFVPMRRRLFDELGLATVSVAETPSRLSDELRFRTDEGWELRMSAAVPAEKSFLALRLLFAKTLSEGDRKNLEYIDLRTENRIFYLLKGGGEKEGESTGGDEKREDKKKKKD